MTRGGRSALALLALTLASPARGAGDGQRFVDYLHVEANEGSSSGGHVALRLGERTFHFQYHDGGLLRLQRDDSTAFVHTYAGLQNRDVHVIRIAVSDETWGLLRRHFNDRFLLEAGQFAALAEIRRDRALIAAMLDAPAADAARGDRSGAPAEAAVALVPVRGAGFFVAASASPVAASASPEDRGGGAGVLEALRRLVAARHGEDLLERRRSDALDALAELRPEEVAAGVPELGPHRYVGAPPAYAHRAGELLENATAAEILLAGRALRDDALRTAATPELELSPAEASALAAYAARLRARLADLAASRRPDWGRPLLLGMARLAALERGAAQRRLVVLDAFPEGSFRIEPGDVRRHADLLPTLLAEARADLDAARGALAAGETFASDETFAEGDLTALETAANRFLELHGAATRGSAIRVASGPLLPGRSAARALRRPAGASRAELERSLAALEAREDAWAAEVARLYRYDLVERNCVSEIFREIEAAFAAARPDAPPCAESERQLGGCVDPDAGFSFIPFASADAVAETWTVAETHTVRSYRNARLAELRGRGGALAVFWRESNVLTSTIYRSNPEDSAFLFFAEDSLLARPLFGAANLVTGLGASAAGLLLLPTGEPDLLVAGLRGTFFSVPELAFVSLRKGSFAYVPRRDDTGS